MDCKLFSRQRKSVGKFPGSPVVMTLCFYCRGLGSILSQGPETPQAAMAPSENKKRESGASVESCCPSYSIVAWVSSGSN